MKLDLLTLNLDANLASVENRVARLLNHILRDGVELLLNDFFQLRNIPRRTGENPILEISPEEEIRGSQIWRSCWPFDGSTTTNPFLKGFIQKISNCFERNGEERHLVGR